MEKGTSVMLLSVIEGLAVIEVDVIEGFYCTCSGSMVKMIPLPSSGRIRNSSLGSLFRIENTVCGGGGIS